MTKKILSILLVACMLATLLVGVASAAPGDEYTIEFLAGTGGSISKTRETVEEDGSVSFTVTEDAGYRHNFPTFSGEGNIELSAGVYTLENVRSAGTVGVTFTELEVVSIAVTSHPDKTEYTVGERLDLDGMEVTATYENGDTAVITSGYTVSPANNSLLSTAGTQDITVTYTQDTSLKGYTYVNVSAAVTVRSMRITQEPSTLTYAPGATINLNGLIVEVRYSDNSTESYSYANTTYRSRFSCSPTTAQGSGTQSVTVTYRDSYGSADAVYTITVSSSTTSYYVTTAVNHSSYGTISPSVTNRHYTSAQSFTMTAKSGYILSYYTVGSVRHTVNAYSTTYTFPRGTTGSHTLTAYFAADSGNYTITTRTYTNESQSTSGGTLDVSKSRVGYGETFTFTATPKTNYSLDHVSVYNGDVTRSYYSTSRTTITAYGNCTVYAYFISNTGEYTISTRVYTNGSQSGTGGTLDVSRTRVDYRGTYNYTATAKSGYRLDYVRVSDDGSATDYTSTSKTLTAHGNQTVYAYFISDVTNVRSISIKTLPNTTTYTVGDTLKTTGLVLNVVYTDGSTGTVSSGFTCSPTTLNTAGVRDITVTYGGKTCIFEVTVLASVSKIEVRTLPARTTYTAGETLNTAGLTLTATLTAGGTQIISSGFTCSPTVLNNAGTQTITVTYGNRTTTFSVTVNPKVTTTYTDVKADKWYYSCIMDLTAKGIVTGNYNSSNNTYYFRPEGDITRAEFVVILARASGASLTSYTNTSFTDINSETKSWAGNAIEWAYRNGIVTGTGTGTFSPLAKITREDMCVMLDRLAAHQGKTLTATVAAITFTDAATIDSWAREAVPKLQRAGIVNGKPNDNGTYRFDPRGYATRAEACKMISEYLKK